MGCRGWGSGSISSSSGSSALELQALRHGPRHDGRRGGGKGPVEEPDRPVGAAGGGGLTAEKVVSADEAVLPALAVGKGGPHPPPHNCRDAGIDRILQHCIAGGDKAGRGGGAGRQAGRREGAAGEGEGGRLLGGSTLQACGSCGCSWQWLHWRQRQWRQRQARGAVRSTARGGQASGAAAAHKCF